MKICICKKKLAFFKLEVELEPSDEVPKTSTLQELNLCSIHCKIHQRSAQWNWLQIDPSKLTQIASMIYSQRARHVWHGVGVVVWREGACYSHVKRWMTKYIHNLRVWVRRDFLTITYCIEMLSILNYKISLKDISLVKWIEKTCSALNLSSGIKSKWMESSCMSMSRQLYPNFICVIVLAVIKPKPNELFQPITTKSAMSQSEYKAITCNQRN